jgi:hypothetical protein
MTSVILTAGAGTRMGGSAPDGCKALVMAGRRLMIEWQTDLLGGARIVCRERHAERLARYGHVVVDDSLAGPAHALKAGVAGLSGPVTVLFADTYVEAVPEGDAWCGVATAPYARVWDVVRTRQVVRAKAEAPEQVCIGLYRFPDAGRLLATLSTYWHHGMGLGPVVNAERLPFVRVTDWQDVGTYDALERFDAGTGR